MERLEINKIYRLNKIDEIRDELLKPKFERGESIIFWSVVSITGLYAGVLLLRFIIQ